MSTELPPDEPGAATGLISNITPRARSGSYYRRTSTVLKIVLFLNLSMVTVELIGAYLSSSLSLAMDAFDM